MIPLRDTRPSECTPVVTYFLLGVNTLIFLVQLQVGLSNESFFYLYGLVPAKYTVPEFFRHFTLINQLFSVCSYMFLHSGFMHFIGNMWFLYIFGDNVECHFGPIRFLWFYLISGVLSGMVHFLSNPVSMVPTIGASGAVAGVMGAYFLLYPRSRILTVIPIIIIPWFIEIPAFIFLGIWFLFQFLNAAGSSAGAGIAWWAHIGGFLIGMVLVRLNNKMPEAEPQDHFSQYTMRKRSPKLQMVAVQGTQDSLDLFGELEITSIEAISGTKKLVTIPWGFYKPLYRVNVPSGVKKGTRLRLAGMGRTSKEGGKGDMYLIIKIKNAI